MTIAEDFRHCQETADGYSTGKFEDDDKMNKMMYVISIEKK